jgi:hypothetical protein
MKKILLLSLILLTLIIAIIGVSWNLISSDLAVWDGTADTSWYNEDKMEFTIITPEQLAGLAELVNDSNDFFGKTVKLGNHIMLNDTANWRNWENEPPVNEWVAIGEIPRRGFQGTFDGNGHIISGVYINSTDERAGLFVYAVYGSVIKNLGVTASYVKGRLAGGLVWTGSESVIKNSYFVGTVIGKHTIGGLMGASLNSEISNSYCIGTVTGESDVGGLVGFSSAAHVLAFCSEDKRCLDWRNDSSSIKMNRNIIYNSYFAGTSTGLVGRYDLGAGSGEIINSYFISEPYEGYGRTKEEMQSKEIVDDMNLAAGIAKMNAWIYSKGNYPVLSNKVIEVDIGNFFASGDGTEINPYIINTKKHLEDFSKLVHLGMDFSNKYLKLGSHIVLNDTTNWQDWENNPPANEWIPIGRYIWEKEKGSSISTMFNGTFDGNGFTISGIYINPELDYKRKYLGLFAVSAGTIKNLGITASYINGDFYVGGVAGMNEGEISNCYYVGNVGSRFRAVGGIVGKNRTKSTISNSYSVAKVTEGKFDINGGLVGENYGAVNNSYYNKETSGQNDEGKGEGKTTAEMKQKATFKGWDFDSVWKMDADANGGYPYLR